MMGDKEFLAKLRAFINNDPVPNLFDSTGYCMFCSRNIDGGEYHSDSCIWHELWLEMEMIDSISVNYTKDADAIAAKNERFERPKVDLSAEIHKANDLAGYYGITNSTWSIFPVPSLNDVPFLDIKKLVYTMHWGPKPVEIDFTKVIGLVTWLDLWVAADSLIVASGDSHHIFVEGFRCIDQANGVYELITGS